MSLLSRAIRVPYQRIFCFRIDPKIRLQNCKRQKCSVLNFSSIFMSGKKTKNSVGIFYFFPSLQSNVLNILSCPSFLSFSRLFLYSSFPLISFFPFTTPLWKPLKGESTPKVHCAPPQKKCGTTRATKRGSAPSG